MKLGSSGREVGDDRVPLDVTVVDFGNKPFRSVLHGNCQTVIAITVKGRPGKTQDCDQLFSNVN